MKRASAIVLAAIMVVSMVALPLGGALAATGASASSAGPSGMVGVPGDQVESDLPRNTPMGQVAADLEEHGVYASDHAGTLDVTVTSPGRAKNKYSGGHVNGGGPVALVFGDDVEHEGREVAVSADVLEDILGYEPEVVYGAHEDGSDWTREVRYEDGYAVFEIPHFSENTATFSGGIGLSGDAADDGSMYQYELDSLDGIDNFAIDLTGVNNTEWSNVSATGVDPSHTTSISIGGNVEPTDGAAGDPALEVTGHVAAYSLDSASYTQNFDASTEVDDSYDVSFNTDGTKMFVVGGLNSAIYEYSLSTAFDVSTASYTQSFDVSTEGTSPRGVSFNPDGSKMFVLDDDADSVHEYSLSTGFDVSTASHTQSFDVSSEDSIFEGLGFNNDGKKMYVAGSDHVVYEYSLSTAFDVSTASYTHELDVSDDGIPYDVEFNDDGTQLFIADSHNDKVIEYSLSTAFDVSTASYTQSFDVSTQAGNARGATFNDAGTKMYVADRDSSEVFEYSTGSDPSGIEVSDGDGNSHTFGDFSDGETKTTTLNLQTSASELNFTGDGGMIDYQLTMQERTQTVDPVVEVNGYTTSYDGTLADGETVSLATNEGWIEEGTNNVSIHTSSPSSGPSSLTGFSYQHDAASASTEVDVVATTWSENVTAANVYPSDQTDAQVNISMHDRVVDVRELEVRYNETSWEPVDSTIYDLDGNDLTVQFGAIDADTKVEVRAIGSKVRTFAGDFRVVEPTVEGDALSTEVEVTDLDDEGRFGIDVSGTGEGDRVHFASSTSWSGDEPYVEATSGGDQFLWAGGANVGSTMTVETIPVEITPQSGAIEAEVYDGGDEPQFQLRQGMTSGADAVDITYTDTVPGERYVLWSDTREVEVDADRASSPVYFTTDGDSETYSILQRDGGGGDPPPGPTDARGTVPLLLAFGGIGGVLVVTGLVGRRFDAGGRLLPITAASLSAIAIHVLSPGRSPIVRALELAYQSSVGPIVGVGVLLLGLWQLDQRTAGDVPLPVWLVVGVLSGIWALETLSPGVVLGGLRGGISTMAPLLIAGGALGAGWFLRNWLRARREEASTPDTQVTLSGFDEGGD